MSPNSPRHDYLPAIRISCSCREITQTVLGNEGLFNSRRVRGCSRMSFECLDPLLLVTRGEGELPRRTDDIRPKRLGPKRLTGIGIFFSILGRR